MDPANLPPPVTPDLPPAMSLPARLANIFAAPGEVFDSVAPRPFAPANWLVPALLVMLAGWAAGWLLFSQPNIQQQLREVTRTATEKQLAKMKLPPDQAEKAMQQAEKYGAIGIQITTYGAPVANGLVVPLIWGLVLWGLGKAALKSDFPLMKGVEVAALSGMIEVLNIVVTALLAMAKGSLFATPSLAFLIRDFDPQNPVHGAASALNLLMLWILAVRALGLARLAQVSFARAAAWVFGVWLAYTGLLIGMGALAVRISGR